MTSPAYLRIAGKIRSQISSGALLPGSALPAERELCEIYDVSRMTARRAVTILEEDGLVYRDGKRGTFVSEPRVPLRIGSFSQELARTGYTPGAETLWSEKVSATEEIAHGLRINKGDDVIGIRRLRFANEQPIAMETSYYPASALPGFLELNLSGSLWEIIAEHYGITAAHTTARMEVMVLKEEVSELLSTRQGAPGISLHRVTTAESGLVLEYAQDVYRADRVSLIIERPLL